MFNSSVMALVYISFKVLYTSNIFICIHLSLDTYIYLYFPGTFPGIHFRLVRSANSGQLKKYPHLGGGSNAWASAWQTTVLFNPLLTAFPSCYIVQSSDWQTRLLVSALLIAFPTCYIVRSFACRWRCWW